METQGANLVRRRWDRAARLLFIPTAVVAMLAACSDSGTDTSTAGGTGGVGGGGSSGAGAATGGAGTSSTSAGTTSAGTSTTMPTAGSAGAGAGGSGNGAGGAAGAAGSAAGTAGAGGAGGIAGSAGAAGSGGGGGTAPVCMVPATGGEDFAGLLVGAKTVEGEASKLGGAAAVASDGSGWSGTGFADMKGNEGSMTWLVEVPAAGDYAVTWRFTQDDVRDMRLTVNCTKVAESVPFTDTDNWNTAWIDSAAQTVTLNKGTNEIVLETNGGSGANFDSMTLTPPLCELDADAENICEAEAALMTGAAGPAAQGSGWTGQGFADMFGAEGVVNWMLDAPQAGAYTLTFVYTQDDTRDMTLSVNGVVAQQSLAFADTGSWNTAWAADVSYAVQLKAGLNSLQLATNGASGPNFDSVKVQGAGSGGAGGSGGDGAGGDGAGGDGAGGAGGAP